MPIYTINELKASLVSGGHGAFWEKAKDEDAVCMYVRLMQENKTGEWKTINVHDVAAYLGVDTPSDCPRSSAAANAKAKENAESLWHRVFGQTESSLDNVTFAAAGLTIDAPSVDLLLALFISIVWLKFTVKTRQSV